MSDFLYDARVVEVHDGDSITLDVDLGFHIWHRGMRIRMFGINAPELNTNAGQDAKAFLGRIVKPGDAVILESHKDKADKYGGRWLGTIVSMGMNLNQEMIAKGHAKPWDGQGVKPT